MAKNLSRSERWQAGLERLSEARGIVEEVKTLAEELKDALQEWLDNMPDNLKEGSKATELEEAINSLEEIEGELDNATSAIDEADGTEVNFPSMR